MSFSFDPRMQGWRKNTEPGFTAFIGPLWEKSVGGRMRYGLLTRDLHVNLNGIVHGGVIATFADFALALESRRINNNARQSTIQLDVHFMDAGRIGEFIESECEVTRQTRSITFVSGRILVGERVIATAIGIWKIQRGSV